MIIEKQGKLKLTRPAVIIDTALDPPVQPPLPAKSGFCVAIVGPSGPGKTSLLLSLVKSKDAYKKKIS
eukprot:SAG11_NODE_29729_length_307_cov_29.980769_1_plen_68_part_00